MSEGIKYYLNKASEAEIAEHLQKCESAFVPPLTARVEIHNYANKIFIRSMRFEAWADGSLVGLVAAYYNDPECRTAYITSVSVLEGWTGKGIAGCLMVQGVEHAKALNFRQICLEVGSLNTRAINLYEKFGFVPDCMKTPLVMMSLQLEGGDENEQSAGL